MRLLRLAGLALHDLWISFRALAVVGLLLLAGVPAIFAQPAAVTVPYLGGTPSGPMVWLSIPLAASLALVSAFAAGAMALERRRGTAGWIVLRSVPRATVLFAWFAAFGLLAVNGLVPAAVLAWLSLGVAAVPAGPWPFAAAIGASLAAGLAAIAAGLVLGSLLPMRAAMLLGLLLAGSALVAAAALTGPFGDTVTPISGLTLLSRLDETARPVADGLRSAGLALGLTAALLVVGAACIERADL
jgi:hypothetical protein